MLMRFHLGECAVVGDIEQMLGKQTKGLRFAWGRSPDQNMT